MDSVSITISLDGDTAMVKHTVMRVFAALLAVTFIVILSGCNTAEGAGEDIEDLGEGIQDAAD